MDAAPKRWRALKLIATLLPAAVLGGCQGMSSPATNSQASSNQQNSSGSLAASQISISFTNVQPGSTQSQTETITNHGTSSVTIAQANVTGTGFTASGLSLPLTLAAGQSATFNVVFSPKNSGSVTGALSIGSTASNGNLSIALSGSASPLDGQLTMTPSSLSLGSVMVGTSNTVSGVLAANGANVTVTSASSDNGQFVLNGLSLPITIPAGQTAPFSITFTPKAIGSASATLTFASNATPSSTVGLLTGSGTSAPGQLTVAPSTLGLGNVAVGASGTATGTLSATGSNVTITAASSSNSRFSLNGLQLPYTVQAGQSATFGVTFTPQATGSQSGTLTFISDATSSSTLDNLTGSGINAPKHTVNLSWEASSSTNVVGYNIYRSVYGNGCGAYSRLNASLNAGTAFGDSTVADGTTYCYVTTAVNSSDEESPYSAVVQAAIPPP